MNSDKQAFMDYSTMSDLAPLILDKQPALLVSADGTRVLWANAAGAKMFSLGRMTDLADLDALERSPARPHIARIAASGRTGRPSIDRLRFYLGRKMVLSTCQCRRVELANGGTAALIVCADKFLAMSGDPVAAFAKLLADEDTSSFLTRAGDLVESHGSMPFPSDAFSGGAPNDTGAGLADSNAAPQNMTILNLPDDAQIVVLDNREPAGIDGVAPNAGDSETVPFAEEEALITAEDPATGAEALPATDQNAPGPDETCEATADGASDAEEDGFVFQQRKRPVRFAWQMDIDQRFTFVSEEFAATLGPAASDIVGQSWQEVADTFALDPAGGIARALDRRETWSGKTVQWPVNGTSLRVPVDMAALPAFDRNRSFEGYRGFGVCRTADAVDETEDAAETASQSDAGTGLAAPIPAEIPPEIHTGERETETAQPDDIFVPEESMAVADGPNDLAIEMQPDDPADDGGHETAEEPDAEDNQGAAVAEVMDLPTGSGAFAASAFLGAQAASTSGAMAASPGNAPGDEANEDAPAEEDLRDASAAEAAEDAPQLEEQPIESAQSAGDLEVGPIDQTAWDQAFDQHGAPAVDTHLIVNGPEAAEPDALSQPAGIEGPESLEPEDIESAVESLAATYPQSTPEQDAVPEELAGEPADNSPLPGADDSAPLAGDGEAGSDAAPNGDEQSAPTADRLEPQEESGGGTDLAMADDAAPPNEAATESVAAENDDPAEETHLDAVEEQEPEFTELSAYEAEFYAETGAHQDADAAAGAQSGTETELAPVQPVEEGNVIPLTTVRPRLVPVDTSGLSRPERQAFRKIAEALGARLEGDLEDFDGPNGEPEPEPAPAASYAGPIDPRLLDKLPIGIAIVHDREVLYGNDTLLTLLGYRSMSALSEAGGLEALFVDNTEELPDAEGMDGEVDETLKVRLADGGLLSVDAHMHSVPWEDGRGLMISIKERAPAKQPAAAAPSPNFFAELRKELDVASAQINELETILESASDGALVTDRRGAIVKANISAEALFSVGRSAMIGMPMTGLLAPESHKAVSDYLESLAETGSSEDFPNGIEVQALLETGEAFPLQLTMGTVGGSDGETRYFALFRDVAPWKSTEDELKRAKSQAENASSQKSEFLAKISHEIRTPLNAIIGFSEVMIEERFGVIGNDRYRDYLKDIRTSGTHIMSLINDLLDLSKIEAGKLDLQFASVSANETITECIGLLQHQANRDRVIIRTSLPDAVPHVVADERSLRQIILNLLSNAIKFNKPGGQVILSTALENEGEVVLRVRDTGTGMSGEQVTAALEPFRQLHTTSHGGGTGLGLPLTKALVEANQASFHIDSTPGQGTLVEIVFPNERVMA